jgi:hypothetical protein
MKLKAITSILRADKSIYTYYRFKKETSEEPMIEERWISNGAATYRLDDRINFTEAEQWLILLDVPEEKRKNWFVQNQELPKIVSFDDTDEQEVTLDILAFTLGHKDRIFRFFDYNGRIITVREEYLKPFWDEDEAFITFTGRTDKKGNIFVAVKNGLFIQAIIAPFMLEKTLDSGNHDNGNEDAITAFYNAANGLHRQMKKWQYDNDIKLEENDE